MFNRNKEPFWEKLKDEFKKYMLRHETIDEKLAEKKTEEFCRFSEVREALYSLIRYGHFKNCSASVLGFTAPELTEMPYGFSKFGVVNVLYDLKTKGPNTDVYRYCYFHKIDVSETPERTRIALDELAAGWQAPSEQ